ncbi:MAG: hypothetical protein F2793_03305 [Actinobacteria bacterium]|nr:hypothetical protein [Actinomycetota bacterium]
MTQSPFSPPAPDVLDRVFGADPSRLRVLPATPEAAPRLDPDAQWRRDFILSGPPIQASGHGRART